MIEASKMKKEERLARDRFRCPEKGHSSKNGWEHPRCFDKHSSGLYQDKVLFFDIEAEDLNADYGIMFNWYAMDEDGNKFEDFLTLDDIKKNKSSDRNVEPKEDSRIVKSLVDLMMKYTRVCGHYSCGYDLPFTRTRAVICGVDFPSYGMLFQSDTWVILKKKFKLSRNSLENGCRKLVGVTHKDKLSLSIKHGCLRGEKWAMDLSRKHCQQDVIDLISLFELTKKYMRRTNSSI
uniref:Putative RNase_H superfamily protein n=1 Tax=viral metagenome TaxID=1070528 RepID=A0A6M3JUA6_9ZZZZ